MSTLDSLYDRLFDDYEVLAFALKNLLEGLCEEDLEEIAVRTRSWGSDTSMTLHYATIFAIETKYFGGNLEEFVDIDLYDLYNDKVYIEASTFRISPKYINDIPGMIKEIQDAFPEGIEVVCDFSDIPEII